MTNFILNKKPSRIYQVLLLLFLCFYLIQGAITESILILNKSIPDTLLEDFGYYERALVDAIHQKDPYTNLSIGPSYLYPPPAFLIIEAFHYITPFYLKFAVYALINIIIMILIISGVAKYYGYSTKDIWFWYVLCFGFAPFLELIHLGQINLITLFGIFLLFWGLNSSLISGFGLSLAILTKVSPVLFFGYFFATKKYKNILAALSWITSIILLSILRYGLSPALAYPKAFQWLTNQFPIDYNSQSLVSKVIIELGFNFSNSEIQYFQKTLVLYILSIIIISGYFVFKGNQPKEPLFILSALGMTVSPNVMWYHHYVFILLPILVWMAWMRLDRRVIIWCLIGMLIIQSDRFFLTGGLLIHIYLHISMILILLWQVQLFFRKKYS